MGKSKAPTLNSYTSISVSSLQKGDGFLEHILSSKKKLFPRKINKPVILYGAGSLGRMAKDFFDYLNIPFLYIVDRNASKYKNDKFWKNVKIVHPNYVAEKDKKNSLLIICIATNPLIALQDELMNSGWKDVVFFYDIAEFYSDSYPITNGWFLGKLKDEDKKNIRKVFSLLADDESKDNYLQFIAWHKLRVELLSEVITKNKGNRFFPKEVIDILRNDEIFVDAGAHIGSVVEKFIQIIDKKYKSIYAIEPDKNNLKILKNRLKNVQNVKIIRKALSNQDKKDAFFQGLNFLSKLDKRGRSLIATTTLDTLKINPTFIKMHLEGGELNPLRGAVNVIKKCRPIIAVTVYHNSDGIYKTPLFLIKNTKNYKYYIRSDSWGGTGVVFYAIPRER